MVDVFGKIKTAAWNIISAAWANPKTTLVIVLVLIILTTIVKCTV